MNRKTASGIMLTLLVSMLLGSFEIRETSANPTVRIYVEMPAQGYIPGIPVDQILKVAINIESPPGWENTVDGIIGWAFCIHIDPEVLEPITVKSATGGYFLYDFASTHGYFTAVLFGIDKEAGLFKDVAEVVMGGIGVGAGGGGKLCELWFKSKSQTAYTAIDIFNAYYVTAAKIWFPVDVVEDGYYNTQKLLATIDIDPDTLSLKSKGKWITAHIQLPEGYDPEDIDVTTVLLNETIQPVLDLKYDFVTNSSEYLVDHNEDGILERMIKFDRQEAMALLSVDEATLTITGEVNEIPFEGSDTIRVIGE